MCGSIATKIVMCKICLSRRNVILKFLNVYNSWIFQFRQIWYPTSFVEIYPYSKAGSIRCVVRIRDASCVMIHASCVWKNVSNFSNVSFIYSSHLVRQFVGKLTHQSKLYVSDSTNLFKHIHTWRTTNTYHASCGPSLREFLYKARQNRITWELRGEQKLVPKFAHGKIVNNCNI